MSEEKERRRISPISAQTREAIRQRTAYGLPNNPSERGMSAAQIKEAFWLPVTGEDTSVLAELDRVASEVNAALDIVDRDVIAAQEKAETAAEEAEQAAEDTRNVLEKAVAVHPNVYIRYSAYADGTDFTDTWQEGQAYMGQATGREAPTDKKAYVWSLVKGEQGDIGKSYAHRSFASALVGTLSGAMVSMDDVSPLGHKIPVKVVSKNLLPYPYCQTTTTKSGITFTDNGDGSVTVNGTATNRAQFVMVSSDKPVKLGIGTYIISGCPQGGSGSTFSIYSTLGKAYENGLTFTLTEETEIYINITVESGVTVDHITFYPQIEKGATATAYTPYIPDGMEVNVITQGKNLFNPDLVIGGYVSSTGVFAESSSGEKNVILKCIPNTDYTVSFKNPTKTMRVAIFTEYPTNSQQGTLLIDGGNKKSYTFNSAASDYVAIWFYNNAGETYTLEQVLSGLQVETGSVATAYEPYMGETITTTLAEGAELMSIAPHMTITTDNASVAVEASYNKDTHKVIEKLTQAIISLGGNI